MCFRNHFHLDNSFFLCLDLGCNLDNSFAGYFRIDFLYYNLGNYFGFFYNFENYPDNNCCYCNCYYFLGYFGY